VGVGSFDPEKQGVAGDGIQGKGRQTRRSKKQVKYCVGCSSGMHLDYWAMLACWLAGYTGLQAILATLVGSTRQQHTDYTLHLELLNINHLKDPLKSHLWSRLAEGCGE
jgi:hypothetical protein